MTSPILLVSYVAVVSDNDGSAFITKAEFDSLKNNFQAQIDNYNQSIDSKIDGAIAAYLAGIKLETGEDHLDIDWAYDWRDSTDVGKVGKYVDVWLSTLPATGNDKAAHEGTAYPRFVTTPTSTSIDVLQGFLYIGLFGSYSGNNANVSDVSYIDDIRDGIYFFVKHRTAANNPMTYLVQNGSGATRCMAATESPSSASYSPIPGCWDRGFYSSWFDGKDIVDNRYIDLMGGPQTVHWAGVLDPAAAGKRVVVPLLRAGDGRGKVRIKFQVAYPYTAKSAREMDIYAGEAFGSASGGQTYFAVLDSDYSIVSPFDICGAYPQNYWVHDFSSGWENVESPQIQAGQFIGLVISPAGSSSSWVTYQGRIIMNYTNLNP